MAELPRRPGLWWRPVATLLVVAAVASPAVRRHDSFPLSTYPVYATARPAVQVLHTAVGVDATGTRLRLSPGLIADSDDPLIVEDRVADAVDDGWATSLCDSIAARAADAAGPATATLVAVEVVSERVDLVAVTISQAAPLDRTVHARCPVTR